MGTPVKYSSQREAILRFLKTRKDHPTADVVFQHIRKDIPNISLATVYRNLNQLAAAGTILRLTTDGKTDHFDACVEPHFHFCCRGCNAVKDIDMEPFPELTKKAEDASGFKIEEATILFSGLCDTCLDSE